MTVDPDDQAEAVLARPLSWKITAPAAVFTVYSWECGLDSGLYWTYSEGVGSTVSPPWDSSTCISYLEFFCPEICPLGTFYTYLVSCLFHHCEVDIVSVFPVVETDSVTLADLPEVTRLLSGRLRAWTWVFPEPALFSAQLSIRIATQSPR